MNQDIFVVIEHLRGQVSDISYVMLAAGRELAQSGGGEVVAVLLGHNSQELAVDLAADRVLYVDHPVQRRDGDPGLPRQLFGLQLVVHQRIAAARVLRQDVVQVAPVQAQHARLFEPANPTRHLSAGL